jgi:hypothetical protein
MTYREHLRDNLRGAYGTAIYGFRRALMQIVHGVLPLCLHDLNAKYAWPSEDCPDCGAELLIRGGKLVFLKHRC